MCYWIIRSVSSTILPSLKKSSISTHIILGEGRGRTVTLWTRRCRCSSFDGCILTEWAFELFTWATERIWSFINSETTVVRVDVGVPSSTVLSIDDGMCTHIILSVYFTPAEAVESTWWLSYISCAWFNLGRRLMRDCESTIVIGDILVPIVSALSKSLLEAVSFIQENRFEMTWTMHLDLFICVISWAWKGFLVCSSDESATDSRFFKIN